jgi:ER lumen protein retaining receptor
MPVALGPAVALALLFNEFRGSIFSNPRHWLLEVLWATSIYLESVAILPQQIMLRRLGIVENITANYVASLGAYRFFYILNWVYRYYTELHYSAWIPWVSGFIQTALYADFFWCYVKSKAKGHKNVDVGILPN